MKWFDEHFCPARSRSPSWLYTKVATEATSGQLKAEILDLSLGVVFATYFWPVHHLGMISFIFRFFICYNLNQDLLVLHQVCATLWLRADWTYHGPTYLYSIFANTLYQTFPYFLCSIFFNTSLSLVVIGGSTMCVTQFAESPDLNRLNVGAPVDTLHGMLC